MRRPADMARSERPEDIHEYRAALMSVFLNTLPMNDPTRLLVPAVQPLMLNQAIKWIQRLPDRLRRKARAHAAYRLAVATFVEGREREFAPMLVELLGAQEERELRARLQFIDRTRVDAVFSAIYQPLDSPPPPVSPIQASAEPTSEAGCEDTRPEPLLEGHTAPGTRALPLVTPPASPPQHSRSILNLEDLTTTVRIQAPSLKSFQELRRILDPRSWDASPFWPEAYQVQLSEDGTAFQRVLTKEVPGESWHGNLFEHVEWNWNTFSVSSFRNFLNISYEVSEQPEQIRLSFSLYACEGSTLFIREARSGVDVDSGFPNVDRVNTPPGSFRIDTQKVIRFADILERRSPLEGPVGTGQILSLMAPAIVGLWMHDLLSNLYFPE